MAEYFKKRRKAGPSKNEEKVSRHKAQERNSHPSNSLAARFPQVQKLSINLDFYSPQQQLLGQEKRDFAAGDSCDFTAPCPGLCGVGQFDLAGKIALIVGAREGMSESRGVCQEKLFAGAQNQCACELRCRVEVAYLPA